MNTNTIGLGDIVSMSGGCDYNTGTVCKVNDDGTVDVFRPYTHTADFSYTGGVICYVGIETVNGCNPLHLTLLRKGKPLR